MFKIPQKVVNDIQKYKDNLEKFIKGELKDSFFKGIRVPWGYYSQRGGKFLMSRLRVPAGIITCEQLNAIAQAAKNFADGKLHITTRQDIQIHNVEYENSIKIIEYLKDFNISPRGGGGNTVRNITGCYLSGVCPYENIEIYKIVWGLTEYLISIDESYNMPRKLKMAVSGCPKDCAYVGVNDVGFIAIDGGLKVLCGGGMGAVSGVGKVLEEKIAPEEVGYVAKSIMNVFNKYGDRKNRHHNRLRFLIQDMGWDKFFELYKQEFLKVKEEEYIILRTTDSLMELPEVKGNESIQEFQNEEYKVFLKYSVRDQKQKGYKYIKLRIPFGEINADTLLSLALLGNVSSTINFRTTQRQNLVISNVSQDKVYIIYQEIKKILKDYLYPDTILDVISCKAATTCNLGICNAIALAPEIVQKLSTINLDKLSDITINMNGCLNACGHHPIGVLALSGMVRKVYSKSVPFYKIYLGGKIDSENTKLSQEVGIAPARVIPKLISEFVLSMSENVNGNIYEYIQNNGKMKMTELIKKYSVVPTYEEDKSYYIDFGKTEDFSLDGLGAAECGAGVIDMMESDLESAKQSLVKAKDNNLDVVEIK
ncbi:MAG: nitrite/sulfite reductase, partial [Candidatus Firestonebacteria bacterium]